MPAYTKPLSHETNLTEVLIYLWMRPDHTCPTDNVRPNVRRALLELGDVEDRGEQLVLTDKGVRQGKFWHDSPPDPPHWMLDTMPKEEGGTGLFHAFESYLAAIEQRPVLCGIQLQMATDHVMPSDESQKCPSCKDGCKEKIR